MALMPGATHRLIARHNRIRATGHVRVNLHVAVSEARSLHGFFSTVGVCSHFYVRKDGGIEQYIDTRYRSGADLEGNGSTISVETQGGLLDPQGEPWTPAQLASLARIFAWACATHGIPARLATDSRPGASSHGLSWHRLGIDPWRVSGGLKYSNSRGKVCPGNAKIRQIPGVLIDTVSTGGVIGGAVPEAPNVTAPDPIQPEEYVMAERHEVREDLTEIVRAEVGRPLGAKRLHGTHAVYFDHGSFRRRATGADLARWGMTFTDVGHEDDIWWLPLVGRPGETYRRQGDETGAVHTFEDGVLYHLTGAQWADIGKVGYLDLPADHAVWGRPVRTRTA